MSRRVLLAILDGWGIGDKSRSDVIFNAKTPYWDSLISKYPHSELLTCGENVGLPDGQMGNSEVGHLNIGAGRVVYQDLVRINKEIREGSFFQNEILAKAFNIAKESGSAVHFIGLVSDGGVHSSDKHLYALCDMTKQFGLDKVFIHVLTDGRDTDPRSGRGYVGELVEHLKSSNGKIASLVGRYYTMDRDKRWERVKVGYDLLTKGIGEKTQDILDAIDKSYEAGVTDEFIKPIVVTDGDGEPIGNIKDGDVVICFNFRTDRLREITTVLTQRDFPDLDMKTMNLNYFTMTRYDDTFKNVDIIYDKDNVEMTLGEVVALAGKKQLRIAETEKYAHVTFFFSGGREDVFPNEERLLVHSPKVATYDLQPEMSAYEVKDKLVDALKRQEYDFVCLNFANGDMVGHTGVYPAILKAVEAVDDCLSQVIETAKQNGYEAIIIADHGNADFAMNPDGSANTAHSLNPVPCILVSDRFESVQNGVLADIAPTILKMMEIEKPKQMTGKELV